MVGELHMLPSVHVCVAEKFCGNNTPSSLKSSRVVVPPCSAPGVPSEADLYSDVDAAYHYLVHDCGIPERQIICYGQSVGSVPTLDLSSRRD
eukprot:1815807-Amphidinium_carterae.1